MCTERWGEMRTTTWMTLTHTHTHTHTHLLCLSFLLVLLPPPRLGVPRPPFRCLARPQVQPETTKVRWKCVQEPREWGRWGEWAQQLTNLLCFSSLPFLVHLCGAWLILRSSLKWWKWGENVYKNQESEGGGVNKHNNETNLLCFSSLSFLIHLCGAWLILRSRLRLKWWKWGENVYKNQGSETGGMNEHNNETNLLLCFSLLPFLVHLCSAWLVLRSRLRLKRRKWGEKCVQETRKWGRWDDNNETNLLCFSLLPFLVHLCGAWLVLRYRLRLKRRKWVREVGWTSTTTPHSSSVLWKTILTFDAPSSGGPSVSSASFWKENKTLAKAQPHTTCISYCERFSGVFFQHFSECAKRSSLALINWMNLKLIGNHGAPFLDLWRSHCLVVSGSAGNWKKLWLWKSWWMMGCVVVGAVSVLNPYLVDINHCGRWRTSRVSCPWEPKLPKPRGHVWVEKFEQLRHFPQNCSVPHNLWCSLDVWPWRHGQWCHWLTDSKLPRHQGHRCVLKGRHPEFDHYVVLEKQHLSLGFWGSVSYGLRPHNTMSKPVKRWKWNTHM